MTTFLAVVAACWPLIAFVTAGVAALIYADHRNERDHR